MGYAAYLDHAVRQRAHPAATAGDFRVLEFTVPTTQSWRVRWAVARCAGAGVLRCEPLKQNASSDSACFRARLVIRFSAERYGAVLQCLLACVPDGELGRCRGWAEHLEHHARPEAAHTTSR